MINKRGIFGYTEGDLFTYNESIYALMVDKLSRDDIIDRLKIKYIDTSSVYKDEINECIKCKSVELDKADIKLSILMLVCKYITYLTGDAYGKWCIKYLSDSMNKGCIEFMDLVDLGVEFKSIENAYRYDETSKVSVLRERLAKYIKKIMLYTGGNDVTVWMLNKCNEFNACVHLDFECNTVNLILESNKTNYLNIILSDLMETYDITQEVECIVLLLIDIVYRIKKGKIDEYSIEYIDTVKSYILSVIGEVCEDKTQIFRYSHYGLLFKTFENDNIFDKYIKLLKCGY